jgi:hypothetical protein
MNDAYFHFLGFIANAHRSITRLSLRNGFYFEVLNYDDAKQLLLKIGNPLSMYDVHRLMFGGTNFHVVRKSVPISNKDLDSSYTAFNEIGPEIEHDIRDPLSAIRLYKEASVHMPIYYCFTQYGENYKHMGRFEDHNLYHQTTEFYILEDEVKSLQEFIDTIKLPFAKDYLQLCLEMFEMSYRGAYPTIAFICLMFGLESLFNTGGPEVTKTISRHVAVLLAKDKADGNRIYDDIRKLYKIRSDIVHGRKNISVDVSELLKLRQYVRDSMKKAIHLSLDKEELFDLLNIHGFGNLTTG